MLFPLFVVLSCATLTTQQASAQTFDAVTGFSASNNPNGVWSYGYLPIEQVQNPSAFKPYAFQGTGPNGLRIWRTGANEADPNVTYNPTDKPIQSGGITWSPGQLAVHPGPYGQFSVIRWTAPNSGRYSLKAAFTGIDSKPTSSSAFVYKNGEKLYGEDVLDYQRPHRASFDIDVVKGDTINLMVNWGGNHEYSSDSTAITAIITPVAPGGTPPVPPAPPAGPKTGVTLSLNVDCMDTTEAGEDEVYLLVMGKSSSGGSFSSRRPADKPHEEAGHINMNDGDDDANKHVNGWIPFQGDLLDGESVAVDVLLMEEDGGTSKPWQELAAAVVGSSENPYAVAAASILEIATKLGFNFVNDDDDFLGAFSVVITNNGGKLSTQWKPLAYVFQQDEAGKDQFLPPPNSQRFYLNGGNNDQRYHVTCYVK
jgi:hypothetical protein